MLYLVSKKFNYARLSALVLICVVFSVAYLVVCDDPVDFGGISALHDSIRQTLSQTLSQSVAMRATRLADDTDAAVRRATREFWRGAGARSGSDAAVLTDLAGDIARDVVDKSSPPDGGSQAKYTWSRWLNLFYFSISNTITMGYGDIYPISAKSKILVVVQMMCLFVVLCML